MNYTLNPVVASITAVPRNAVLLASIGGISKHGIIEADIAGGTARAIGRRLYADAAQFSVTPQSSNLVAVFIQSIEATTASIVVNTPATKHHAYTTDILGDAIARTSIIVEAKILEQYKLTTERESYVVTARAADTLFARLFGLDSESCSVTTSGATFTRGQGVVVSGGEFTATGYSVDLLSSRILVVDACEFLAATEVTDFPVGKRIRMDTTAYVLTGRDTVISRNITAITETAEVVSFASPKLFRSGLVEVIGSDIGLSDIGASSYAQHFAPDVAINSAAFRASVKYARFLRGYPFSLEPGELTASSQEAIFLRGYTVIADVAEYVVTSTHLSVINDYLFQVDSVSTVLETYPASITYGKTLFTETTAVSINENTTSLIADRLLNTEFNEVTLSTTSGVFRYGRIMPMELAELVVDSYDTGLLAHRLLEISNLDNTGVYNSANVLYGRLFTTLPVDIVTASNEIAFIIRRYVLDIGTERINRPVEDNAIVRPVELRVSIRLPDNVEVNRGNVINFVQRNSVNNMVIRPYEDREVRYG